MRLRFRDWPLRWKMMTLLLAASSLPLVAVTVMVSRSASAVIRQDATDLLHARAEQLAGALDEFHHVSLASVSRFVEFPETREYLLASPAERAEAASRL